MKITAEKESPYAYNKLQKCIEYLFYNFSHILLQHVVVLLAGSKKTYCDGQTRLQVFENLKAAINEY